MTTGCIRLKKAWYIVWRG